VKPVPFQYVESHHRKALPFGIERQDLLRKAGQVDTAAHIDDWLNSPGLQPPKQEARASVQYQDIEIKFLRMGAPGGWKWTVTINGKEKSGSGSD
jgi:hypothetical protein